MSETSTVPPIVNKTMKLVLRSPVHGAVSKSVLLITFTGRKSGKTYTTPVSYSQLDDQVYVFTHAAWWKNLRSEAPVTLRIRGRELQGLAEPVAEDKQAVAAGLSRHLRMVPSDARYYGVTFDDHGDPSVEEVEKAAQTVVMIRIRLAAPQCGVVSRSSKEERPMSFKKFTFQALVLWAGLALALELFAAPVLAQPVSAAAFQGSSYEAIDAYVKREMGRASIPGLAYGIVFHDQIVHLQAFGIADPSGHLVTPQTPFIIGSVAKTFTALAIRQLINQGEIDLNAPVQRYIPWFRLADPEATSLITIRQLLSHTSGLSHADGNLAIFFQEGSSIEELVRRLDQIHVNRPVGSSQEYSNLNYLVLGQVVQMVSGQPFAEYVQTNIFQPLEMKHSYFTEEEARQDGLATGYHIWYGFPVPMQADFPTGAASHGYAISSVEDMAHYLIAYLNRGSYHGVSLLLPAASNAPAKPAKWYDIYWNEYSGSNDRYSQVQSGGTYNFNGILQIMGDHSEGTYGIVVLMNTRPDMLVETVNALSISEGISSLILNGQVEKTSVLSSLEWYLWWGLVDLGLLGLLILAFYELFSFRRWSNRIQGNNHPSLPAFVMRAGIDMLAGIFGLIALPVWQGLPWRDLLKPYCELCPFLISSGTILIIVAIVKIAVVVRKALERSKTNTTDQMAASNSGFER